MVDQRCVDCVWVEIHTPEQIAPVATIISQRCDKHEREHRYYHPQVLHDDEGTAYIDDGT